MKLGLDRKYTVAVLSVLCVALGVALFMERQKRPQPGDQPSAEGSKQPAAESRAPRPSPESRTARPDKSKDTKIASAEAAVSAFSFKGDYNGMLAELEKIPPDERSLALLTIASDLCGIRGDIRATERCLALILESNLLPGERDNCASKLLGQSAHQSLAAFESAYTAIQQFAKDGVIPDVYLRSIFSSKHISLSDAVERIQSLGTADEKAAASMGLAGRMSTATNLAEAGWDENTLKNIKDPVIQEGLLTGLNWRMAQVPRKAREEALTRLTLDVAAQIQAGNMDASRFPAFSNGLERFAPDKAWSKMLADQETRAKLPEGVLLDLAKQSAASWADREPAEAGKWAATLSAKEQEAAVPGVVSRWLNTDAPAATEWVQTLPEGPVRNAGITEIIRKVEGSDPELAAQWRELMAK
ncbi:hypothetical protein [Luteolibacter luteus]|uniref:Uncharacterized protein n=1 Tax=Luteolibacter luteus TaxID=2728835 RepID=A0A858RCG1_9BACT|nr:hypothetical protein [Luteolibacter luteus]QJE94412.1 hypothetical protein HHL09_00955 [Luteolibacter luteus]